MHLRERELEEPVENAVHRLGTHARGQLRRVGDVAEQHRDQLALAFERRTIRKRAGGEMRWRVGRCDCRHLWRRTVQRCTAFATKLLRNGVVVRAMNAPDHRWPLWSGTTGSAGLLPNALSRRPKSASGRPRSRSVKAAGGWSPMSQWHACPARSPMTGRLRGAADGRSLHDEQQVSTTAVAHPPKLTGSSQSCVHIRHAVGSCAAVADLRCRDSNGSYVSDPRARLSSASAVSYP